MPDKLTVCKPSSSSITNGPEMASIVGLSLREYFELGVFCITNKISIAGFVKGAIREKKTLCELGLLEVHKDNTDTIKNSIKKQNRC